jgi:hypothetical protein
LYHCVYDVIALKIVKFKDISADSDSNHGAYQDMVYAATKSLLLVSYRGRISFRNLVKIGMTGVKKMQQKCAKRSSSSGGIKRMTLTPLHPYSGS